MTSLRGTFLRQQFWFLICVALPCPAVWRNVGEQNRKIHAKDCLKWVVLMRASGVSSRRHHLVINLSNTTADRNQNYTVVYVSCIAKLLPTQRRLRRSRFVWQLQEFDTSCTVVPCATFIKMATLGSNGRGYRTGAHARVVRGLKLWFEWGVKVQVVSFSFILPSLWRRRHAFKAHSITRAMMEPLSHSAVQPTTWPSLN